MTGLPMLVLSTVGRRTGRSHPTPLAYLRDGRNLIIVAGNRGASRDPWWMHNLRAHPYATVEVDRRSQRVCATIIEGPERRVLWPRLREAMPPIASYEARTSRIIPVVRLAPIAEAPSHSDRLRHQ
jgi:deazaflavin-dependent oxidoreductase (nitroreductase family)